MKYIILILFIILGSFTEEIYTTGRIQITEQTQTSQARIAEQAAELSINNRTLSWLENHYTEPETYPNLWPIVDEDYTDEGRMTSYYGYRNNPLRLNIGSTDMKDHFAIDVVGVEGARVQNVGWGVVINKWYPEGWHNGDWYAGHGDFNGYVEILLDTGFITKNGHIYDITVHEGDRIAPGHVIGRINPTADSKSTGPHLHFGMLNPWGQPVQPLKFVGVNRE